MIQPDEEQKIENLISALNAPLWQTRAEAADTLIQLGVPAVLPLMDAISNARFGYHYVPKAVQTLGSIGDSRAVDLLIDILASDHVHAVQEAIKALGRLGDPRAIEPLINVFRHDWNDTETITAWQTASTALAAIGQIALPALRAALKDESNIVREGVIDALEQLNDARAVPDLIGMLQDEDKQVRATAAEALGHIGELEAVEPLVALLTDKDADVRERICYALGDIGGTSVFNPLVRALSDAESDVRSAAVVNLGRIAGMPISVLDSQRHRAAIESLKKEQEEHLFALFLDALQDPTGTVRAAAASRLGQLGDERALPALYWIQKTTRGMQVRAK